MQRETPRYKAEPMRRNAGFWMVVDTHKVMAVEMLMTQECATEIANQRNAK